MTQLDGLFLAFQFYDSPIKSFVAHLTRQPRHESFNSMIVRLKECGASILDAQNIGFNSMIVRLKGDVADGHGGQHGSFQFYDSPIKSIRARQTNPRRRSFNSMIVRLKGSIFCV